MFLYVSTRMLFQVLGLITNQFVSEIYSPLDVYLIEVTAKIEVINKKNETNKGDVPTCRVVRVIIYKKIFVIKRP